MHNWFANSFQLSSKDGETIMVDWTPMYERLPPEGVLVMTKIDDSQGPRNHQKMKRQGRLWFVSDGSYVYYTPTHWMPL